MILFALYVERVGSVRGARRGGAPSEQAAAGQPRRRLALLLVGTDLVRARPRARWVTRLLHTRYSHQYILS